MANSREKQHEFRTHEDNVEFNDMITRLASMGLSQQRIAGVLGVSPGQVSRVKNGERHASSISLRKLRKYLRKLADERSAEAVIAARPTGCTLFEINQATLQRLSADEAVTSMRDLLWARATARGVPSTRVSISSNVCTPDGGVDASILEPDRDDAPICEDELLTSGTRYQIKTGDFSPWQRSQVDEEVFGKKCKEKVFTNLGSEIQVTLAERRRFVVVAFGVDLIDRDRRKARANFQDAFRDCGYPHAKVEVWGQTQLIGLFNSYPSLCLRLRGHDQNVFRSHLSWSLDDDMQPPIHYSPEQLQLIDDLREDLRSGTIAHVRLLGEPGIGKTRLALQLTGAAELAPVTLYVKDSRSLLQSSLINELMQTEDHRFVVFVVDDCSSKDLADIWNILKPRASRIRLISIDHGPDRTVDDKTRVVAVEPAGVGQIVSILKDHGVGVNDATRWADYCEGCPRVAHVIGANLNSEQSDLLAAPTTSEVWRRFIDGRDAPDSEAVMLRRIVLQHISLFLRFGFEKPVNDEASFIQKLAERCDPRITGPKFRAIVCELKDRRILQGASTLYVTPRLLHVHLFRDFWRLYGSDFDVAATLHEMPQQMWRWFVEMLRYGHDCPYIENAIDKLLGHDGMFQTGLFPDTSRGGQMVSVLAETCPEQTLSCLRRTLGKMETDALLRLTEARQYLVWTLEKLAVWDDCFEVAAGLLLDLAEAENAKHSNNATNTFVRLFSLIPGWAPTKAPPLMRLQVLTSALHSTTEKRRLLGLKACAEALSTWSSHRLVGPEHQGLRPTIHFWAPQTYDELWDSYTAVWQLLVGRLAMWYGEDRKALITTIIGAARSTLRISRMARTVLTTLTLIASDEATDIKMLVELIRQQLRSNGGELTDDTKQKLQSIFESLEGTSFASKIRRFVKYVAWGDYRDTDANNSNLVQRSLDELAVSVRNNPELMIPELPWIICEDSSPAYGLAYRIGRDDLQRFWWPRIVDQYAAGADAASPSFMSGYLRSVYEQNPHEWESRMEEVALAPSTAQRFSDFAICSGMTDTVTRRVIRQCRTGLQNKDRLRRWSFDSQLEQLNENAILELIELQLEDSNVAMWDNAVQMCHTYYLERDQLRQISEEMTFKLLVAKEIAEGAFGDSTAYYWSRLAKAFVRQFPQRKWDFFKAALLSVAGSPVAILQLETTAEAVLSGLLIDDPTVGWSCIADVYRELGDGRRFGLQHWLASGGYRIIGDDSPGPIQHVPSSVLFEWVDKNIDDHGYWLAGILPKTFDKSRAGRLTRDFIANYGRSESIRSGLVGNFHSRGWSGNGSDYHRKLREEARKWLSGEKNGFVTRWIEDYIEGLSAQIERDEVAEERRF